MAFSLRVGRFSGVPLHLHWSLFVSIPLFSWVIGSEPALSSGFISSTFGVPVDTTLMLRGLTPYLLGIAIWLVISASFFLSQMATVLAAGARGTGPGTITLYILGGSTSFGEDLTDFQDVLPVGLAGPATHLLLGLLALLGVHAAPGILRHPPFAGMVVFLLGYSAILNLAFGIFSLLPGLPMNGGQVLQAWLGKRMPRERAARISSVSGKIIALLFVGLGVFVLNIILIIIGILIYLGARAGGGESSMAGDAQG